MAQRAKRHSTRPPGDPPVELPEWLDRVRKKAEIGGSKEKFLRRAIAAILELTEMSDEYLQGAVAAESDYWVLLRALQSPEALKSLKAVDPLAPAYLKGIEARRRLLMEEAGVLSVEQAARVLGISRYELSKRRVSGKLLAVPLGRKDHYPAWQFTETGTLQGLERVLGVLSHHDPWMQLAFFVNKNERLGRRKPVDVLRSGAADLVIRAAEAYCEHGMA
jgi:hypothetical protein